MQLSNDSVITKTASLKLSCHRSDCLVLRTVVFLTSRDCKGAGNSQNIAVNKGLEKNQTHLDACFIHNDVRPNTGSSDLITLECSWRMYDNYY
jgi:hypothetical protein